MSSSTHRTVSSVSSFFDFDFFLPLPFPGDLGPGGAGGAGGAGGPASPLFVRRRCSRADDILFYAVLLRAHSLIHFVRSI